MPAVPIFVAIVIHAEVFIFPPLSADLLRGVSGGEKKRVTVGEGLITNARFLALDE